MIEGFLSLLQSKANSISMHRQVFTASGAWTNPGYATWVKVTLFGGGGAAAISPSTSDVYGGGVSKVASSVSGFDLMVCTGGGAAGAGNTAGEAWSIGNTLNPVPIGCTGGGGLRNFDGAPGADGGAITNHYGVAIIPGGVGRYYNDVLADDTDGSRFELGEAGLTVGAGGCAGYRGASPSDSTHFGSKYYSQYSHYGRGGRSEESGNNSYSNCGGCGGYIKQFRLYLTTAESLNITIGAGGAGNFPHYEAGKNGWCLIEWGYT